MSAGGGRSPELAAFMSALGALDGALDTDISRAIRMKQRIVQIRQALADGRMLREVVTEEESPLIVQLISEAAESLGEYGSRVRRTEARALHVEGLTMDAIAELFGVSRQRVSALLRDDPAR